MQSFLNPTATQKEITIIGAAILDILAGPVNTNVFQTGSQPMEKIRMAFGGDALNEALALNRLGKKAELITKVGKDDAGQRILDHLSANGLSTRHITIEEGLETGINIVLVDQMGERHFLTNPASSLRKINEADICPYLDQAADIVSFASIFVSPELDLSSMERIFKQIKEKPGRTLVLDMTKPKHGETLHDLKNLLPYVDYMLPNQEEIALLTGESDPVKNARLLVNAGVSHAVIKTGKEGCILAYGNSVFEIPAYPVSNPVDTTGAGDSFAAGFLWALSNGWSPVECCRFACATASCSVECFGATDGITSLTKVMERYHLLVTVKE